MDVLVCAEGTSECRSMQVSRSTPVCADVCDHVQMYARL